MPYTVGQDLWERYWDLQAESSLGGLRCNACEGWRKQNWGQGEVAQEASADPKGCLEAGIAL